MRPLFRYNAASAGLLMLMATCGTEAAQEFAGREKLRAHSAEFRREVIKVTVRPGGRTRAPSPHRHGESHHSPRLLRTRAHRHRPTVDSHLRSGPDGRA